jgi:hypothetical protein
MVAEQHRANRETRPTPAICENAARKATDRAETNGREGRELGPFGVIAPLPQAG